MTTYRLHLVRHGLTEANENGIYCGKTDLPLCATGLRDLQQLAETYNYPCPELVYTSPLLRARQTASILFPDCEQTVVDDLREASFGIYEGKSFQALQRDDAFQKWVTFGSNVVPPGAEPHDVFHRRCVETCIKIVETMMRNGIHNAAVLSHAGVIANILATLAYPKRSAYDWQCYPGCGYTVIADPSLFLREPVLEAAATVPEDLDL